MSININLHVVDFAEPVHLKFNHSLHIIFDKERSLPIIFDKSFATERSFTSVLSREMSS